MKSFQISNVTKMGAVFGVLFLAMLHFAFDAFKPMTKKAEQKAEKTAEQKAGSAAIDWIFENSYADSIQIFSENSYMTFSKEDRKKAATIDSLIVVQDIFCDKATMNIDSLKKEKNSMSRDFYVREITFYADDKYDQYNVQVICDKNFNVVEHKSEKFTSQYSDIRRDYFFLHFNTNEDFMKAIHRGDIKTKCK